MKTLKLSNETYTALEQMANREFRQPEDQLRYLLKRAGEEVISKPTNKKGGDITLKLNNPHSFSAKTLTAAYGLLLDSKPITVRSTAVRMGGEESAIGSALSTLTTSGFLERDRDRPVPAHYKVTSKGLKKIDEFTKPT